MVVNIQKIVRKIIKISMAVFGVVIVLAGIAVLFSPIIPALKKFSEQRILGLVLIIIGLACCLQYDISSRR